MVHARCQMVLMSEEYYLRTAIFPPRGSSQGTPKMEGLLKVEWNDRHIAGEGVGQVL